VQKEEKKSFVYHDFIVIIEHGWFFREVYRFSIATETKGGVFRGGPPHSKMGI
jgi:hypothetical protein